MASKNLKRLANEGSKLEMTAMIDVTFLLLIFFMCTLQFKTLEGKLQAYLPKNVGVNVPQYEPLEKVAIELRVRSEGTRLDAAGSAPWDGRATSRFTYGPDRVIEYRVGTRTTSSLTELEARLRELHLLQPDRPATIAAGRGANYEDVVGALDAALDAGFHAITFAAAQ